MSYIAGKLKHRIQILQGVDTPNTSGGFSRSYTKLIRLWSWKKPYDRHGFVRAIRGVNTETTDIDSDEFGVRYNSVISKFEDTVNSGEYDGEGMGKAYDLGFSNGYDSITDIYPIKTDFFVFLEAGAGNTTKGRLYKINRVVRDDNLKEFFILRCSEIEEQGLGAPA